MKLRHLLMAVIAGAFAFTACEDELDLGAAKVSFVEPAGLVLNFGPEESSANVTFVCTRDWNISEVLSNTLPDWIALSATSGEASTKEQSVTITVMENPGNDRETTITFTIGLAKATLTVKQQGKMGEYVVPTLTIAEFIKTDGETEYIISGKVTSVNTNYKYAYINDGTGEVEVYQPSNWADYVDKIKVGVTLKAQGVYTKYTNNSGKTYDELVGVILSVEGDGESGTTDYSNAPSKTVKEFIAAADVNNYYKLTGKVSNFNATYCSFDLTDETGSIYVYSVDNKADWSSKVANGGTVSLAGKYAFYAAKEQHEVVNAYILTFEGSGNTGNDDTPTGNGTLESPYNPKAAYDAAAQLEKDAKSENDVYIAGVISSIKYTFSAQYGTATFNISEDGTTNGTQFPCYSVLYLGNRAWVEGDTQVAVGDRVVICGKITNYGGNTPETASKLAYIYSLNGQTTIEQGPVFGVEKTEINVAATATGAVIKVTGNVPWTATSTAIIEGGSVSGNGAGEFSVAFDPNTDTENTKVYTATVVTTADVANKEIRVTITQAKASSGGGTHYEVQWLQEALAAAPAGGAVNQMDDVISFINSSSYGSTVPTELRIYKNQTLTIKAAAGYTIEDIEIGCTAAGEEKYGPGCFTVTPDGYTFNDKSGRWAGDAQEVVFTAATNQVRIVDLKVHYKN